MKILARLIILIIVLLLVVITGMGMMINTLARLGIQAGATHALGVESTVEKVNLNLFAGKLRIDGLTIANPEGFETEHLMHSGRFELEMKPMSVLTDTIEISRFDLDGLDVNIEQRLGGSNVSKISDNLSRFESDKGKDEDAAKEDEGKNVKVDRITIRNVTAHFHMLPELHPVGPITVNVPIIELTDVTSDNAGGVAVPELVRRLLPAILAAILEKAEGVIQGDLAGQLRGNVGRMTDVLGDQAGGLVDQTRDAGGKVSEAVEAIGDLLEGITGGKDEEE